VGNFYGKLGTARNWCPLGICLVSLMIVPHSFGQGMAALSGKVADTQGALIPSAVVTATQSSTGTKTVVNSNTSGQYVFPSLPPASYSISVSATGFKTFDQVGILLQADQSVTVDVTLQLGQASQTVEVTANTAQVNTTTATLSSVIDRRSVDDLPLNGRNAAQLTEEVPGVILGPVDNADQGTQKAFPSAVTVSVNGARTADTNFMFDGGNNIDELYSINQPFPFPDALQEFSIQTNNYNAEYGQNAGGVVNIVSKSGGDAFHGDLFEYVRNGMFNASNFFSSTVDPLKRNQFGGTLGGPVEIPHLGKIKRSFFFVGYQRTINHDKQGGVGSFIATQANLNGDFSALESASNPDNPVGKKVQIDNPFTGQPYPGDIINPSSFNPAAVAITKALPSVAGNGAIYYQNPLIQTFNEILVRGDQDVGSADHVTLRFYRNSFAQGGVYDSANLLTYNDQSTIPVLSALVSERHTFSPTLLNTLVVNYSREVSTRGPLSNVPNIASFGVNIPQPPINALAGFSVSSFFTFGTSAEAIFRRNNYTLSDEVYWVKGRHSMAFGVHAELAKVDINSFFNNSGSFTFNSNGTNYALASFLLGYIYTFNQGSGQYLNDRNQFYGFYAQDSWRATSKLTLNYGVRYEPFKPWAEVNHKIMQFSPTAYAAGRVSTVYPLAPPGLLFPGDAGVPEQGIHPNYKNVMPRVGFAYDVHGDGTLSVRGGGGLFYDTRLPALFNQTPSEITPFSTSVALTTPQGSLSNPYQGITDPFLGPPQPPSSYVFPLPVQVEAYDPSGIFHVQLTYAYNFTVQQQLSKSATMTIAYAGSHSSHMFVQDDYNPSIYIPGSTLGANSRRVYKDFSDIDIASMSGNGAYNSLQATIQHRIVNGLSVTGNYTFSKAMDTLPYNTIDVNPSSGPGAPYAIPIYQPNYKRLDIGPSDFDRTNVFSGYYVWQFPKLTGMNLAVREVVNGWETTGIVQAQSGQPLTITAGSDISGTALLADRAVWNGQRPYGGGACISSKVPCKNYLNPADFSLPAAGTFGNVVKGSFRGPGYFDWDAGLSRSFPIEGSMSFEFRAEYFNVINRNNLNNPNIVLQGGGFGAISSAAATESPITPRVAQFSAKLVF
jgi:Carboxypeptidase regulatory-like domain/TonB dependent receptor